MAAVEAFMEVAVEEAFMEVAAVASMVAVSPVDIQVIALRTLMAVITAAVTMAGADIDMAGMA